MKKMTKRVLLAKKFFLSNEILVPHHTFGLKKKIWTIFLSAQEEKYSKSEFEYSV